MQVYGAVTVHQILCMVLAAHLKNDIAGLWIQEVAWSTWRAFPMSKALSVFV